MSPCVNAYVVPMSPSSINTADLLTLLLCPTLPYPAHKPYSTLPYHALPCPALPYSSLPFPCTLLGKAVIKIINSLNFMYSGGIERLDEVPLSAVASFNFTHFPEQLCYHFHIQRTHNYHHCHIYDDQLFG